MTDEWTFGRFSTMSEDGVVKFQEEETLSTFYLGFRALSVPV